MKFGKMIIVIVTVIVAIAIILFVHGETSVPDTVSPFEQLSQDIAHLKETYPQLIQANLCTMLQEYTERVKPTPGRPMVDLGFTWELQRRVLEVQCRLEHFFTKTVADLSRLERELRVAHDALQKELAKSI